MAGYILILAILILGGAIATLGDRLGTRVGKARLSLFNLRPKKTAILVTILTGSLISATTLGILLAASQELRDGIFRLAEIKRQQRQVRAELVEAQRQRNQIQQNLSETRSALTSARTRLSQIRESLEQAIQRQQATEARLNQAQVRYEQAQADLRGLRSEIERLDSERQQLIAQRNQAQVRYEQAQSQLRQAAAELAKREEAVQQLRAQRRQLEQSVKQVQTDLQAVKAQRDRLEQSVQVAQVRADQAQAELQKAQQEQQQLLNQQAQLQQEIATLEANQARLERNFITSTIGLRSGNVAIRPGQVLASGIVREIESATTARQAIDQLLREANRVATQLIQPQSNPPEQQVVQIAKSDFQRLVEQIDDGQPYAIRLVAALNVIEGEGVVLVVPQVVPNQMIFSAGERIASVSLDLSDMNDDQILERLDTLFAQSNRRAIQAGLLRDPLTGTVGSFSQAELIKFILQLKEYQGSVKVATVVPDPVFTAGPLKLELIASKNQDIILRSN